MCLALAAVAVGCREQVVVAPERIVPLYKDMARFEHMDSVARDSLMRADSAALSAMFLYLGAEKPDDETLLAWSRSLPVEVFTPAVDSVFPDLNEQERILGDILRRADEDSLDLPRRVYAAVVWGNRKSIVLTDSVMLIALNHYLGADYPGYSHWPAYMRLDKTPAQLPYDMAEALVANKYPYKGGANASTLSRLVYEGALTLAKIRLVPGGNMGGALGYTEKQLQWLGDNEHQIWLQLIDRQLLYDTSETTAERLVAPAPATSLVSPSAPGRIGRYIGYRIICAYERSNAKIKLKQMLQPEFYNNPAVLVEAAYDSK